MPLVGKLSTSTSHETYGVIRQSSQSFIHGIIILIIQPRSSELPNSLKPDDKEKLEELSSKITTTRFMSTSW